MNEEWPPYQPYQPPAGFPPPAAQPPSPRRRRGVVLGIGLVGAGAAAGAIIGGSVLSNASTPATTANAAVASYGVQGTAPGAAATAAANAPDRDSSKPVRSDEKALSTALTAKLKAAALKAVPGGTVVRIESDSGDATYEAHMTKSDGTRVTVKFDKNGAVTGVETGMGK